MKHTFINPKSLAEPKGFNHGILVSGSGSLLFMAGQDAGDGQGKIVAPGDLVGQFEQVLLNLKTVVEEAGGTVQDIVKLNIFVKDRDRYVAELDQLGTVFRSCFGKYYPAMALFEVSAFFRAEALIELEGIAHIPEG